VNRVQTTAVAWTLGVSVLAAACTPGFGVAGDERPPASSGTSSPAMRVDVGAIGSVVPPVVDAALAAWVCADDAARWDERPTLFVAPDGSDAADGRAIDRPLRTLSAAAERVEPGDLVWVRSGVYREAVNFTRSGTRDAPIVIASAPGECAVIDGGGTAAAGTARTPTVAFRSVDHVVFRDFVVRRSPAEGILLVDATSVTLEGLHLHDHHFSGVTNVRGRSNRFVRIVSHDNVDVGDGGDADGISISSGDGHRVERCIVFRNSDDGIDTWTSTGTVVERCLAFGNGRLGGDGNGVKAGGDGAGVGTLVRRSVAYGNRANGFDDNTGRGVRFEHATAYANGRAGFAVGGATLAGNLSLGNAAGDRVSSANGDGEKANSWTLGVGPEALVSLDPVDPDFLAPLADGPAADLGALRPGDTLASLLGLEATP
jgi:parallel beta-helix repeat protein